MDYARAFVEQVFAARGSNFPKTASLQFKEHRATVDLGKLAFDNGGKPAAVTNLFVGTNGNAVGISRQLTPADTSLLNGANLPSSECFVMTGIGFALEPIPVYESDPTPTWVGANPFVAQRALEGYYISSEYTANSFTTWGSIGDWPASDSGPRLGGVSQTANNSIFVDVAPRGGIREFGDPESTIVYGPNAQFQHTLSWGGDSDLYLTDTGASNGVKIRSWRGRLKIIGYSLTGFGG